MKEIKFRVFSHSTKSFLKVDDILFKNGKKFFCGLEFFGGNEMRINYYKKDDDNNTLALNIEPNDKRFAINQYTGIKDKHNNEIYEGDIIKYVNELYKVEFHRGSFIFKDLIKYDSDNKELIYGIYFPDMADLEKNCEIVGNIYENSHL